MFIVLYRSLTYAVEIPGERAGMMTIGSLSYPFKYGMESLFTKVSDSCPAWFRLRPAGALMNPLSCLLSCLTSCDTFFDTDCSGASPAFSCAFCVRACTSFCMFSAATLKTSNWLGRSFCAYKGNWRPCGWLFHKRSTSSRKGTTLY